MKSWGHPSGSPTPSSYTLKKQQQQKKNYDYAQTTNKGSSARGHPTETSPNTAGNTDQALATVVQGLNGQTTMKIIIMTMCSKNTHSFFFFIKQSYSAVLCCVVCSADMGQFPHSLCYCTSYDCAMTIELSLSLYYGVWIINKKEDAEHVVHYQTVKKHPPNVFVER